MVALAAERIRVASIAERFAVEGPILGMPKRYELGSMRHAQPVALVARRLRMAAPAVRSLWLDSGERSFGRCGEIRVARVAQGTVRRGGVAVMASAAERHERGTVQPIARRGGSHLITRGGLRFVADVEMAIIATQATLDEFFVRYFRSGDLVFHRAGKNGLVAA